MNQKEEVDWWAGYHLESIVAKLPSLTEAPIGLVEKESGPCVICGENMSYGRLERNLCAKCLNTKPHCFICNRFFIDDLVEHLKTGQIFCFYCLEQFATEHLDTTVGEMEDSGELCG